MAGGIEVVAGNQTYRHSVIWHEVPKPGAVFIIVKDGALGLSSEGYVAETLASVWAGDVRPEDAWDQLLIQTADMDFPVRCTVEAVAQDGQPVAKFRVGSDPGRVCYFMEI